MKPNDEKRTIIILGGGFAGVRVALDLSHYLHGENDYEIILIDKKDYQCYQSGLYEAATTEHGLVEARKVKRTVTIPFDKIFAHHPVKVFKAYIDSIDLDNGKVVTDSRILSFDYLVVAMGSVADFYGIPGLDKYAFTLKTLDDAIMIRNRIEELVTKKDFGTIVVGGGGFAGAEFVGEVHNLIKTECKHHGKTCENYKVLVVEGSTGFLPGLPERIAKQVGERLGQMGVETKFSTLITEAGKDYVVLNKTERVNCDLLIWTGGVRSYKLPFINCTLDCDKKDRLMVSDYLNLKTHPNVFIAGDNACFTDPVTGKPVPQTAQEAINQGKLVAKNIYRQIKIRQLLPYHPSPLRYVIPVSGKYAIMYTPYILITGFNGWVVRRMADLRYFLTVLPFTKALGLWFFENSIFMKND